MHWNILAWVPLGTITCPAIAWWPWKLQVAITDKNRFDSIHKYRLLMIQMWNISLLIPGKLSIRTLPRSLVLLPLLAKLSTIVYRDFCNMWRNTLLIAQISESTSAVLSVKMNHSIYHHEATRAEQLRTYKRRSSNHKGRKRQKDYKDPYDAGCKSFTFFMLIVARFRTTVHLAPRDRFYNPDRTRAYFYQSVIFRILYPYGYPQFWLSTSVRDTPF